MLLLGYGTKVMLTIYESYFCKGYSYLESTSMELSRVNSVKQVDHIFSSV